MIIRAPLVYPVEGPPIENGAVVVEGDCIAAVGPAGEISSPQKTSLDLPSGILLPGFVNAHSHLELTSLEGLPYPGNFADWIRNVVEAKPQVSEKDYKKGIRSGIRRMLESGITTVADHVSFNTDLEAILSSPLRGILFVEVLGVVKEVAEDLLLAAENFESLYRDSPRFRVIASPHSAHALHPEVLPRLFKKHRPVLSIHLGESDEEDRYFHGEKGPLYDLISERQKESRAADPKGPSSIQHLEGLGFLSPQILAVHANYLDPADMKLMSKHRMSVVHCPSSHAYFSHRKFPLDRLIEKEINIALGTDSLASGPTLSMLEELRIARKNYPEISAPNWIQMATLGGARALKMENEIGSIAPGKKADLIAFSIRDYKKQDPSEILKQVFEAQKAQFVMIDGKMIPSPL